MSILPLLILLSLAVGATAGVQLVKRGFSLRLIFALFAVLIVAGFYLLSNGYDKDVLDTRGVTELTNGGWVGLCCILFTLSMGTSAFVTKTVENWPKPRIRRRRR